ncbi:MAG: hypothetical protein WA317_13905 [Mycobacterium sp.]|uniref:hypothetical protein n=1 Tax=Mycobacterium sp. TaxID=1785 RepID=UPI003CC64699
MSSRGSPVIEGVDVDALAAAVRSCQGVDDLERGPLGSVATYLPGRQLAGIRIGSDRVTVQVKGTWGVSVHELVAQIKQAAAPFVGNRTVDIVLADLTDPTPPQGAPTAQDSPSPWTTPNAAAAPNAESSSAPTAPSVPAPPATPTELTGPC